MKQLFINLPVKDVDASMEFYSQLGFVTNPLFTFDNQKCMAWTDQVFVMLQSLEISKSGEHKIIADPKTHKIATFTLPVESIDQVNQMMENGIKAGGKETTELIDEGFMQIRNIEDLDGHHWGIIYLDIEKFKEMKNK